MAIGNIIVGQSGGPTAVINASLVGIIQAARDLGAPQVYGMRYGIEGFLNGNIVDLYEQVPTEEQMELLKRTPSAFLGSCRFKLPALEGNELVYQSIFEELEKLKISHFFYIGGNDSMDTIKKLSIFGIDHGSDITFIGIPKTIDNDLPATDHTPGYGSAAKYIATSVKEISYDAAAYERPTVTIVEIMGRNAGWLTAASALAKCENDCDGPDLIYLPERVFSLEKFLNDIRVKFQKKKGIVVAVSEGIKIEDGRYVCDSVSRIEHDAFGHKKLGGTATVLADLVDRKIGCRTRTIEFSSLQRCAAHLYSKTDMDEAYTAGYKGVELAAQGENGKMVAFVRTSEQPYVLDYVPYDIDKIANLEQVIPDAWITENGTGISQELIDYITPLVQGEVSPVFKNGVPCYLRLSSHGC